MTAPVDLAYLDECKRQIDPPSESFTCFTSAGNLHLQTAQKKSCMAPTTQSINIRQYQYHTMSTLHLINITQYHPQNHS